MLRGTASGEPQTCRQVTAGEVDPLDGVWQCIPLVDGDGMRDAVPRIDDHPRRATRSIERQDGLDLDVERRGVERLEHDLGHLFAVDFRVHRRFRQEDGVFFRGDAELIVELA